jgi:hypothetical protein
MRPVGGDAEKATGAEQGERRFDRAGGRFGVRADTLIAAGQVAQVKNDGSHRCRATGLQGGEVFGVIGADELDLVGEASFAHAVSGDGDGVFLPIDGDDFPPPSDEPGHSRGVVTIAGGGVDREVTCVEVALKCLVNPFSEAHAKWERYGGRMYDGDEMCGDAAVGAA